VQTAAEALIRELGRCADARFHLVRLALRDEIQPTPARGTKPVSGAPKNGTIGKDPRTLGSIGTP
jgi:hypothetical protein